MKNIVKLFIVGSIAIVSSFTAKAQKVAHINLDSLISLMPETSKATQQGQDLAKQLEEQIGTMQKELQEKYDKFQIDQPNLTPLIADSRRKELEDLNRRIQEFQQQAQQEFQKKTGEFSKPVYDKAKKAIAEVAKENGYKYVLDISSGVVIYNERTDDIIASVIKKLGFTPKPTNPIAPLPPTDPKK
ncbi:MAG TPA: OmpH family outer membrane protein [Bacteroidia bacterium]|jgi:outer membrane protein|nr:OmpH family outer membrane protein [Bacteroidia bacterium]HRG53789.1 OmpH family outer membrane protein [Bacteroidia bacterium]